MYHWISQTPITTLIGISNNTVEKLPASNYTFFSVLNLVKNYFSTCSFEKIPPPNIAVIEPCRKENDFQLYFCTNNRIAGPNARFHRVIL